MKRQSGNNINNVKENIIMMRTAEFEKIYKEIREEISELKAEIGMLEILWPDETDEISDDFYMLKCDAERILDVRENEPKYLWECEALMMPMFELYGKRRKKLLGDMHILLKNKKKTDKRWLQCY